MSLASFLILIMCTFSQSCVFTPGSSIIKFEKQLDCGPWDGICWVVLCIIFISWSLTAKSTEDCSLSATCAHYIDELLQGFELGCAGCCLFWWVEGLDAIVYIWLLLNTFDITIAYGKFIFLYNWLKVVINIALGLIVFIRDFYSFLHPYFEFVQPLLCSYGKSYYGISSGSEKVLASAL